MVAFRDELVAELAAVKIRLDDARPTAVNLSWVSAEND
jgi:methylthioribose-1-phosphate isomerase